MYLPANAKDDVPVYWPAELTGNTAHIAIIARTVPETEPADVDWHAATWEGTYGTALLKVGPGAVVLTPGEYVVWARVVDGDNRPMRRAGTLTIGPVPTP